jgi:hypothetical protein
MKKDKLCVPLQTGSEPAAVAAYARENCAVPPPDTSGVQARWAGLGRAGPGRAGLGRAGLRGVFIRVAA